MTQDETRVVLNTARNILASRSKFALFCMDLSEELYGVEGLNGLVRSEELQEAFEAFWREAYTIRVILGE